MAPLLGVARPEVITVILEMVLHGWRMRRNVEKEPLMLALITGNYKEQVTWRDAATSRLIAESDFFEGLTVGALITPGFGGRVYFPTAKGFITMQVMPAPASR